VANRTKEITSRLTKVSGQLAERGEADLSREIDSVIADLHQDKELDRPGDVLTTGEAATLLGVRSVFTIKRWARDGLLEGFRRGGRILVTRASVDRMLRNPNLAEQHAAEADLASMDVGDEPVPHLSWSGRKPWEADASAQT
jgi:excisionase family DNA binding protein